MRFRWCMNPPSLRTVTLLEKIFHLQPERGDDRFVIATDAADQERPAVLALLNVKVRCLKLVTCLNVLSNRHRLIKHPVSSRGEPTDDDGWLDLALESHATAPFYGVVLSQLLRDSRGLSDTVFMNLSEVLDSDLWEKRSYSVTLRRTKAHYRNALTPVLKYARTLTLVDPYMSCYEPRFFEVVQMCVDMLGQRGYEIVPGRIHIHAGNPERAPRNRNREKAKDRLDEWERKLRPLIDARHPHKFRVFLWAERPGGERMHDRFILTDQIGIVVPGGLDHQENIVPGSTDWTLLDEEARIRRLEAFDPPTSPFALKGQRTIA